MGPKVLYYLFLLPYRYAYFKEWYSKTNSFSTIYFSVYHDHKKLLHKYLLKIMILKRKQLNSFVE